MTDSSTQPRLKVWRWLTVLVIFAIFLMVLNEAVRALVRARVDGLIEANHGKSLPDFDLLDNHGKSFSREQLQGKVAILHFMRSLCHSCQLERPRVRAFSRKLASQDDVVLWSILMDPVMDFPPNVTQGTLKAAGFPHPILMADEAFVDAFHGVGWAKVTPITYFANKQGKIVTSLRGPQTEESLQAALELARGTPKEHE